MKSKYNCIILYCIILILFSSCTTTSLSNNPSTPRTLALGEIIISEDETDDGFTSWCCVDPYAYRRKTLVEVGTFTKNGTIYGFILYDGGDEGELTHFSREGLEYRWDWDDYTLVIQPDGTALYYDFTNVPYGESTKPRLIFDAYKC